MKILSTASLALRTASLKSELFNSENIKFLLLALLVYLFIISLSAFIMTVYDKYAAKKRPERRVRESTLIAVGALGGAVVMLLTMLTIRHKTKHLKFMIGLPLIILAHIAILVGVIVLL